MIKHILFLATCLGLLLVSCSKRDELSSYVSNNKIVLPEESSEDYISCIDSIGLIPLSVDKDWVYIDDPFMCKSYNSWFLLDQETYHLMIYDILGNKMFSRVIKGRGRGEVLNVGNIFCIGDSVCIFDIGSGRIIVYDNKGQYKGFLNNKNEIHADLVFPIGVENYVAISNAGFSMKDNHYVSYMDKDFKSLNTFISLPDYLFDFNIKSKNSTLAHIYDDTLRFMLQLDYNIFSLTKDTLISSFYLNTSNPIVTDEISARDTKPENTLNLIQNIYKKGYAAFFSGFGETERFITFNYIMNQKKYNVLIDKNKLEAYSFSLSDYINKEALENQLESQKEESLLIWKLIISNSTILYSDEDCIYCSVDAGLYNILKVTTDYVDERLVKLYNEMKKYYTDNVISANDHILLKMYLKK